MGSWRVLADIESGTRENEVITPWSQMPYLIQLVQGTEQALPLYDPVHGSGPGEIVFLAVLPTAMIRYMVVVLARVLQAANLLGLLLLLLVTKFFPPLPCLRIGTCPQQPVSV